MTAVSPTIENSMKGSEGSTFVIDLIAAIRALVKLPDTYMDLVRKLLGTFLKVINE